MKIFTPNVRLVEELTKYIRPQEIERARFKKFNTPIINDGNLACDEFFRMEELLDRKKDVVTPFTPYSVRDVPVIDRTSPLARDIQLLQGSNAEYIESDVPYYVDIIGENKRIYIEKYGTKNPKYPYEADFDVEQAWTNKQLYENCSVDDVVNIRYFAEMLAPNDSKGVEWQGLKLLKDGFPLKSVINIMKEAATKSADGQTQCSPTAMKFIAQYPKLRRYMITYSNNRSEVFDLFGAKMFPELMDICKGNEKLAHKILWDCRIEMPNGSFLTEPELLQIGEKLYQSDNSWTPVKAQIIRKLEERNCRSYNSYIHKIDKLLAKNTPEAEILERISPHKNVYRNAREESIN